MTALFVTRLSIVFLGLTKDQGHYVPFRDLINTRRAEAKRSLYVQVTFKTICYRRRHGPMLSIYIYRHNFLAQEKYISVDLPVNCNAFFPKQLSFVIT
jgi:hypothetical protein